MKKNNIMYKITLDENGKISVKEIKSEKELNEQHLSRNAFIQNTAESIERHKNLFREALLEAEKAFK